MTNNKEAGAEQTASIAVAVVLSGCEEGPESSFFLPLEHKHTLREVKLQILLECPMRLGTKLNWQHLMLKFGESCASLRFFQGERYLSRCFAASP